MKRLRKITNEEIKTNVMEYFNAGRLTAQTSKHQVLQDLAGNRCAIGAVLTQKEIEGGYGAVSNLHKQVVKFADVKYATDVQRAHDLWAIGLGTEEQFLKVLNSK